MDKPKALRLAYALKTGRYLLSVEHDATAAGLRRLNEENMRRLHEENAKLKQSVARLQQHHATAWNRGHTMGMKANEDTARRALDAVKQDAWGNTQLTEALLKAEAQRDALLEALKTVLAAGRGTSGRIILEAADEAAARAAIAAVEGEKT